MKKITAILLSLVLLLSCGCTPADTPTSSSGGTGLPSQGADPTIGSTAATVADAGPVAEPLTDLTIAPACAKLQNPVSFFGDSAKFHSTNVARDSWAFSGDETAYEAIKAYVALLQKEYGFVSVMDPYEQIKDYRHSSWVYFEFILNYAGEHPLENNPKGGEHTFEKGDIVITGSIYTNKSDQKSDSSFDVIFNSHLRVIDQGHRYGKEREVRSYCGDSFGAGLIRNPDGSFETGDGRLKANVGEAMLISGGATTVHTALFNLSAQSGVQEVTVSDAMGIYQVAFAFPITRTLVSGALYEDSDLVTTNRLEKPYENTTEKAPNLGKQGFHILHGEKYFVPQYGMLADFKQVSLRTMYVDKDYSVAVFYFCADFATAPDRTEGLIAVQLNGTGGPNGGMSTGNAKVYNLKVGEQLQLEGGEVYGSHYHVYIWSFLGGSEFCEMHDTNQKTATVIAHRAGTVRIKLEYKYTEDTYDSILGINTYDMKSATTEYVIYISE